MKTIEKHENITDLSVKQTEFSIDILTSLTSNPKTISAKYLYDKVGSDLFEKITELEEYYQTRTELNILVDSKPAIFDLIGENADLIELGSGSSTKTQVLLDNLNSYIPIDISKTMLADTVEQLNNTYPNLKIHGIVADYTKRFSIPELGGNKKVIFFPGSTIGNFEPLEAEKFLKQLGKLLNKKDGLLIGIDLVKDRNGLENAYNDQQGITAAFNLNLLTRINRELNSNFQLDDFYHKAIYNSTYSRIEMHLISKYNQTIQVHNQTISFEKGESIHTENSYKYSIESFQKLCLQCGLHPIEVFVDDNQLFSVHYLEVM